MQTLRRLIALILKEFLTIMKDPKSRFVVIVPPILQFLIFSYAATFDLENVRYAVFDECRSVLSRSFLAGIEGTGRFKLTGYLENVGQVKEIIDNEKARLMIHIGPRFEECLRSGRPAPIQVIADGRSPNVAMIAIGYLGTIVENFNNSLLEQGIAQGSGPGLALVERAWFNENLSSRWFMVSALGGVISTVVVMTLISLSVAREREFGTFDQLLVAPFSPVEILVGKSMPGIVFGMLDALIFSGGAVLWFHIPFRGTISALMVALLCFIITLVGIGLLVSSLSTTMQQGLLGAFLFLMPAITLSGLATPVENMPMWLQQANMFNPVRHIITALRRIFLEGADLVTVWPQIWPLLIMACITLPLATWLFRHRSV
ncbi:antibiotic ABC transporter permease [Desulfobacter hydrogenophilus]|uniref:Transport permease protein n=1 Tax=Desulfobacter hydrogenophilus TaxID=2291 RepID=A0A328FEQ5_9BACT|nr:ABC transporter permease [Desulfobacter hydrogenophilus]NDY72964.1 ABC transporter permease [Desulfobacter hydrogenophilus]QBH12465.1 ABC transporter permease [Desulfobacter hydrogenophilus]RAM01497.1 antibiotic ABC transporter permease [Desulfobacter hydrogenophilus]